MAMFLAKSLPEPKTQVYSETVNQQVARRLALETAMHQAIKDESFYLVFQPQYHLEQNKISGKKLCTAPSAAAARATHLSVGRQ